MSMLKFREKFTKRRSNAEEGSDIITTLMVLPLILGLIFALIDVSTYFQTRSTVQNITRDGARQVALYGGAAETIPLNTTGKSVAQNVLAKLYDGSNCIPSGCAGNSVPKVLCGPVKATSLNADAYCTVTYKYRSIGGGLVEALGFGAILSVPIEMSETFKVETKY